MENEFLTYKDLPAIYKQLAEDLPPEAIDRVSKEESRKAYDMTGYAHQFVVNRLNEVVFSRWRVVDRVVKTEVGKSKSGKPTYKVIKDATVQIGNRRWVNGENLFEILAEGSGYGGHTSLDEDSAFKGARTNAFKKAAAMLGVGKKAYEGLLDEEYFSVDAQIEQESKPKPNPPEKLLSKKQLSYICSLTTGLNMKDETTYELLGYLYGKDSRTKLSVKEAKELINYLKVASKTSIKGDLQKYRGVA